MNIVNNASLLWLLCPNPGSHRQLATGLKVSPTFLSSCFPPLGLADLFTMDVCPRYTCRHCPVLTSHLRMVQSALQVKAASSSSWQKVT